MSIRCSLNEDDENKMRFENLMKQILQLIKLRSVIIKTRKIDYKTKKTTTLMKKMKSIIKKNVSEYFINLLKTMKSQNEESISNVDVRLDDLTEVMRKMTMNVDNLINCVFFSNERDNFESSQDYQSYMFSRYSSSNQSLMLSSRSFSLSFQNMFFQNMSSSIMSLLNNEVSHSSFIKCIYCYEKNHLYKRKCVKFNENLKVERIHLQKKKIHLDFYNFDVFHIRMILYKNQRQCVESAKKLAYSNRVVATVTEIHIVRLRKNADLTLFINEKEKKTMLMNHELYVNVDVIFATIRSKFKMSRKFVKHHEFIKRILKKKEKKEKKLLISKILRSSKWKKIIVKKKTTFRIALWKKSHKKTFRKQIKIRKKWKSVRVSFLTNKKLKLSKRSKR